MFAEMVKGVGEHDTIGRHHVHCACVCGGGWSVRWVGCVNAYQPHQNVQNMTHPCACGGWSVRWVEWVGCVNAYQPHQNVQNMTHRL